MENGRDILFINSVHEQVSQDFDPDPPLFTAWYGLARTWPAVFDESTLTRLRQKELKMSQITGQAVAAQEAVGEIFLASLYQAEATLAAVEQINQAFTSTSERPALEAFHRTQRTRYLAWLSQIAMCGAAQILATMR